MENKNIAITATANRTRYRHWIAYFFYPTGVLRVWQYQHRLWVRVLYTLVGLPFFLVLTIYFSILVFASFYPPLDTSMGKRNDRTVFNSDGNYRSTFVKSGYETGGAYELIQVELEPHAGNGWHYHTKFDEFFTVLRGKSTIGKNGKEFILNEADSAKALRGELHFFCKSNRFYNIAAGKGNPGHGFRKKHPGGLWIGK